MSVRKRLSKITLILLGILFVMVSVCFIKTFYDNKVRLVVDSSNNKGQLPKNFRMCKGDLYGVEPLNSSGSGQFSKSELAAIKEKVGGNTPIIVVDLKQESHGFINGTAVSWVNRKNNLNKDLSQEQVLIDEKNKLSSIVMNQEILISDERLIPTQVQMEKELVESLGMTYVRMPVNDKEKPRDDTVDEFIQLVKTLPADEWLHFHCEEGMGRTTTFMVMYDMMKNAKKADLKEIMDRQVVIGGKNLLENNTSKGAKERAEFLRNFYTYAQQNNDHFTTTWSQWIESN